MQRTLSLLAAAYLFSSLVPVSASAIARCKSLPKAIKVTARHPRCGTVPTVVLGKGWNRSFSAAFRWNDGSDSGQDRSPTALDDSSASSSPYKTQRRIASGGSSILCYGRFLNRPGFSVPVQLTIKRTPAPKVERFCVSFPSSKGGRR